MTTKIMQILAAYLHVIGVATYLGGSIIMEFVIGPAQKAIPPAQAQVLGEKVANRFLAFAWSALGLILASGILRIFTMNTQDSYLTSSIFDSPYGRTLFTMVMMWCLLAINGAIMTFVLRPRLKSRLSAQVSAGQAQSGQSQRIQAAKWTTWLARADLVIISIVAFLGSSLGFGGVFGGKW